MGGQTGTENLDGPHEAPGPGRPTTDNGSPCDEEQEPVDADDSSLGYSANDVLKLVIGEKASELRWMPPSADASFGPEQGIVPLELEVGPVGNVRRVHSVPKAIDGNGAGPAIAIACPPDRLEADVELRMATGAGALDERIAAVITMSNPEAAALRASIPLAQISGSFRVVPAAGVKTDSLEISALFSRFGHAGVLSGQVEAEEAAGVARAAGIVYGRWPADETCPSVGVPFVPVALDDAAAAELRSAVERVRAVESLPLRWSKLGSSSLSLGIETAAAACFRPGFVSLGMPSHPASLDLPVTVQIETGDGRVNGTVEGTLSTMLGVAGAGLNAGRSCAGATVELKAEACGVSGIDDLAGLEDLSIGLAANVPPDGNAVSGAITILGVRPTMCEPTPDSACGSRGAEPIETGEF
jgi:hypothetical protein